VVGLGREGVKEGAPRRGADGGGLDRGGSSPVRQGGDGRARERLWGERVPFPGSIGAEGGRRWELDRGQGKTAATARGGGVPERRGELDSARIWEGSGQGGRERALRELKRKERTEGAGRWRRGARHGTSSSWRFGVQP